MLHSTRRSWLLPSLLAVLALASRPAPADAPRAPAPTPTPKPGPRLPALPPPPEGVTSLEFSEFFERPVGPRGLVFTARMRSLHGQRVRILGFMVRRDAAPSGTLILTAHPVQLHDFEYGLADDLPPSSLFVSAPDVEGEIPYTPGPLLLTGRLDIGNRDEPDGRVSAVRLLLDPRPKEAARVPGPVVAAPTE